MKKAFGIFLAIVLLPVTQVQAWVGGPFGGDSYFPNGDDGIYEAYATLQNGTGLFRFAVRNNGVSSETSTGALTSSNVMFNGGLLAASSTCIWYFRGVTYVGPCSGIASTELGIVSAIGNARSNPDPNPLSNGIGVNGTFFSGPQGTNIDYANSTWTAKIKQKFPVVRFNGSGTVSFLGSADTVTEVVTYTDSMTTATGGTITITRTEVSTDGEKEAFGQVGKRRKFLVFGSRVSTVVAP